MRKLFFYILFLLIPFTIFSLTKKEMIEKEFSFKKGYTLTINNINGSIVVNQWEKEILRVEITRIAKGTSESSLEETLKKQKLSFLEEKNGVKINVSGGDTFSFFSWLWGSSGSIENNFKIFIPKETKLDLSTVNGEIFVDVYNSDVKVQTVNGKITVLNSFLFSGTTVNGEIDFESENIREISTVNGAINGKITSQKPRSSTIEAVNGSITLSLKREASFSIKVESVMGVIKTEFNEIEGERREKRGDVNGGGETIELETVNGSITIKAF